jgi:hypothetical protein
MLAAEGSTVDYALKVVPGPAPDASILAPTQAALVTGSESDNQLCGFCSALLIRGVSQQTIRSRFAVPSRLLIRCPDCGSLNQLPAQVTPGA